MRAFWFLAALLPPAIAFAQVNEPRSAEALPCMSSSAFAELLYSEYGERPFLDGADGQGMPVRWFANPQSGTWTMAVYPRPEVACHALDGKSFRPVAAGSGGVSH